MAAHKAPQISHWTEQRLAAAPQNSPIYGNGVLNLQTSLNQFLKNMECLYRKAPHNFSLP